MAKDYYQVLGLSQQASEQEIKHSFRQLAMKLHPDSNSDPNAHDLFLQLNEAYQTLSDPQLRKQYDLQLQRFKNGDPFAFQKRKVYQPGPKRPTDPADISEEERRRRYREAKIKQEKAIFAEFVQYRPYVKILSWISLGLMLVFLLDWGLGKASEPEKLVDVIQSYEPGSQLRCEVQTPQRILPIRCNRVELLTRGDYLTFYSTPLFGKTYRIIVQASPDALSSAQGSKSVRFSPKPSIYNIFSFFWVLLIGFAVGGLIFDKKPDFQFRFGLGMLGLIPLNLLMLYLS
ncbi:MAG: J domain-containing protein [Bacteroidota bacterium]